MEPVGLVQDCTWFRDYEDRHGAQLDHEVSQWETKGVQC